MRHWFLFMLLVVILAACSDNPTVISTIVKPSIHTEGEQKADEPAQQVVAKRALLKTQLDRKYYYNALTILNELYDRNEAGQNEFDVVFPEYIKSIDTTEPLMAASSLLSWQHSTWFPPYAEKTYLTATKVLRPVLRFEIRHKYGVAPQAFGCWDSGSFAAEMAVLAEKIGRKKEARRWKIHHADILATNPVCEQCAECGDHTSLLQALQEYRSLGMTSDANKVIRDIRQFDPTFEW